MNWSKNYSISGKWFVMGLTEEELKELIKQHKKETKQIYIECLDDATRIILESKNLSEDRVTDIANSLFERRALALFSLIENKLDENIRLERERFELERKKLLDEKEDAEHD